MNKVDLSKLRTVYDRLIALRDIEGEVIFSQLIVKIHALIDEILEENKINSKYKSIVRKLYSSKQFRLVEDRDEGNGYINLWFEDPGEWEICSECIGEKEVLTKESEENLEKFVKSISEDILSFEIEDYHLATVKCSIRIKG